jgi:hypothetical protein
VEHRPANYETHSDAVRNKFLFVELRGLEIPRADPRK